MQLEVLSVPGYARTSSAAVSRRCSRHGGVPLSTCCASPWRRRSTAWTRMQRCAAARERGVRSARVVGPATTARALLPGRAAPPALKALAVARTSTTAAAGGGIWPPEARACAGGWSAHAQIRTARLQTPPGGGGRGMGRRRARAAHAAARLGRVPAAAGTRRAQGQPRGRQGGAGANELVYDMQCFVITARPRAQRPQPRIIPAHASLGSGAPPGAHARGPAHRNAPRAPARAASRRQVCEAWVSVLCELLPSLGRDAVLREVVPLALSKGQVDESVASRVLCCRLLGAATPWLVRGELAMGGAAARRREARTAARAPYAWRCSWSPWRQRAGGQVE